MKSATPEHRPLSEGVSAADKQAAYTEARRRYWEEYAKAQPGWNGPRRFYRRRLAELYRFAIPPGARVLELGCGEGDLLAALQPSAGVGLDLSSIRIEQGRRKHPHLRLMNGDAHTFHLAGEQFDYVVVSDLINDLWDVQQVFETVRAHVHPGTRVVMNFYSRLWEAPRRVAEALHIARPQLGQNWLTVPDVKNLLYLAGFETIQSRPEILWPIPTPGFDALANRYLVKLWPWNIFALTHLLIARPMPAPVAAPEPLVTVVVPARNEAGNISQILDRLPEMGGGTELIFVEGNSTDDTFPVIERELARRPGRNARLFRQTGKGKGDAVRLGFANASGGVLMILDADMTVPPEDLPRFYDAWRSGRGEFVNGVRLVYPMEDRAMRFFNLVGNKFFSLAFSWLLNQSIKDTLCGTKVLSRAHYEVIARNRAYFGEIDPFGDFDLIFGAAKYNLKMVDLPVRYAERTYGDTNIQRWRHGVILLRMVMLALRRIKFI
ncbi:MAG TPA: glycosyltransferase [Bryobacteraceae bacterium]|nr:glycosyltransferase [Bryobacteraceae bacterium]